MAEWLIFWSTLLAGPPTGPVWKLTDNRAMQCYVHEGTVYQYIYRLDTEPTSATFSFDGAQLCQAALACHATDEVLGYL